jgi:pimeloyl-ACP methyl ester carboxylesterase
MSEARQREFEYFQRSRARDVFGSKSSNIMPPQTKPTMTTTPFRVAVPQAQLDDLKSRLEATIWPDEFRVDDWRLGPTKNYVQRLAGRWRTSFDWRAQETRLNKHPQFLTEIDGQIIHFLHVRASGSNAQPLLLLHGWPGSVIEYLDVIEPLTNPVNHGGSGGAFDLVIPSLPGYAFSGPTREAGWDNTRMAKAFLELMSRLGYERFGVQGGDMGAIIAPEIARQSPARIIGVHVHAATIGFIPLRPLSNEEVAQLNNVEKVRLARLHGYMQNWSGYNTIQSQRPQALAFALSDSPAGWLAWSSELFTGFGEKVGAVPDEAILANATAHWVSGTAASSMRNYYENAHNPNAWAPKPNSGVPTAVAVFDEGDVPIRRFSEEANTIVRWTEYAKGGHYPTLEVPEVWTKDVREFFSGLR